MSGYAPQWAFSAQATDSIGDPHLSKGIHLRLLPGEVMGLPIFPFRVYRVNLGQGGTSGMFRTDLIRWVDSKNNELTTPFTLSADNPVTAYLPPLANGVCCWIEIAAEPAQTGIRTDAQIAGYHGVTTLTSATTPKYQMAASRIDRVVVTGSGRVSGARWLDGSMLSRYATDPWRLLSLPVAPNTLYSPTATAPSDAIDRVKRGGPLRQPMYNAPAATGPATSPLIGNPPAAEKFRIESANTQAKGWLAALTAQGSVPPSQLRFTEKTNTPEAVKFDMSMLDAIWLSSLDPGMAKWLGFADVDDQPVGVAGDVVAYIIKGIWQQDLGTVTDPDLLNWLGNSRLDTVAAMNAVKGVALATPAGAKAPFFDLFTVACATIGKPGISPAAPVLEKFEYKPFLPALPPAVRREIVIRMKGFVPGPGAALARQAGQTYVCINPKRGDVTLPLIVSTPSDATKEGKGKVSDRNAPADALWYRMAQADWFGRWSPWNAYKADAMARPKPPKPVVQAFYAAPDESLWDQQGLLAGTFTVAVPVPANDSLAPGSYPLATLKVKVGAITQTAPVGSADIKGNIILAIPGPGLMPCASATVTITANWIDTQGTPSDDSLPVVREIHDPRAPEPVELDYALDYSSRPDSMGKSRIDLRWNATGNQARYRVYYASETILLSKLALTNPGLAQTIGGTAAVPARAQLFKDNKNSFDRAWFELLTKEPLDKGGAAEMRLVHEVSGKLATLGFYRVASVSAANVEGKFHTTPMVAYAVPNAQPPNMPLLNVTAQPATLTAEVTIRVPRGATSASRYRLRRTTGTASDASRMKIVSEGPMSPAAANAPMQEVKVTDGGLKPWKRYFWRAEVRGEDLPGSSIRGDWSKPGAPVEAFVIPKTPPAPVDNVVLSGSDGQRKIAFHHNPADLNGGSAGRFRLELYKHIPGSREKKVATLWADAPLAEGGFDAQGNTSFMDQEPSPKGTAYRVLVVDPLERISTQNITVIVPGGN